MVIRVATRSAIFFLAILLSLGILRVSMLGGEETLSLTLAGTASEAVSHPGLAQTPADGSPSGEITAADKYAVVIGIVYDNYELGAINYADRDAATIFDYLTGQLGFPEDHVILLLNDHATRTNILASLEWLADSSSNSSNPEVVFFFSGHGLRTGPGFGLNLPDMNTAYALVPHDFLNFDYHKGQGLVWDKELAGYLSRISPAKMWVSIDSCFSGGFNQPGIAGPNRVLTLSSQWDELSSEINDAQRSVMTQYMVEEGIKKGIPIEKSFTAAAPRAFLGYGQNPLIYDGYPGDLNLE